MLTDQIVNWEARRAQSPFGATVTHQKGRTLRWQVTLNLLPAVFTLTDRIVRTVYDSRVNREAQGSECLHGESRGTLVAAGNNSGNEYETSYDGVKTENVDSSGTRTPHRYLSA